MQSHYVQAVSAVQAASAVQAVSAQGGPRWVLDTAGLPADRRRLRCASVIKPLLFWMAARSMPFRSDPLRWTRLAERGVTVSDNAATVEMWQSCGSDWLLDAIAEVIGARWPLEAGGARSFGRVLIRADELARAYASMVGAAADGDPHAAQLLEWMRQVPDEQSFGVRRTVVDALGIAPAAVGIKAGWFCDSDELTLRTHVVAVVVDGATAAITVVLTAIGTDPLDRARYSSLYREGAAVLPMHQRYAGSTICSETRTLLRRITR